MLESAMVMGNSSGVDGEEKNNEKQIEELETSIRLPLAQIGVGNICLNVSLNDFDRDEAYRDYYHKVESLLPRLFRGPFFVFLHAVVGRQHELSAFTKDEFHQ